MEKIDLKKLEPVIRRIREELDEARSNKKELKKRQSWHFGYICGLRDTGGINYLEFNQLYTLIKDAGIILEDLSGQNNNS